MVRPASYRATSRDLAGLAPLRADHGTGLRGASLGSLHRGGEFVFDPFAAYHAGLVTGPNVMILGRIGSGKSAVTKMMIRRAVTGGASAVVLDPKGEYSDLASSLGGRVVTLGDAGWFHVVSGDVTDDLRVICGLVGSARGRPLDDEETMKIEMYWRDSNASEATRPLRTLLHWCQRNGEGTLASTVHRFVAGDLKGLIDGDDAPDELSHAITVLNIERWWGTEAMATVAMLAWVIAERALATGAGHRFLVADEAWSVLDNQASLLRLRGSLKLARASGTSHILILHRLADLEAVGDVGSRHYAAALSLLRDCDSHFMFQANEGDVTSLAREFGLTDLEQRYLPALPRGAALVRYGPHRSIVRFEPTEEDAVDTDRAMR